MSAVTTWLITGSSRGIGFELTRQLTLSPDNCVIATCRNPEGATQLAGLSDDTNRKGELHIVQLDVSDEASARASVEKVEKILGGRGLDVLYNNVGVTLLSGAQGINTFDFEYADLLSVFKINVAGPALVAQLYLPLLEQGRKKVIVNVSSTMGSIGRDNGKYQATYALTKTALNMLSYKQAKTRPDIIVIALCPGRVKTEFGGPVGNRAVVGLEPHESVSAQLKLVSGLTLSDSGKFLRYDGEEVPW